MSTPRRIEQFNDRYRFLSNFFPVVIFYEGDRYPSVEHAYQAAKCRDREDRKQFQCRVFRWQNITAGQAKRLGRKVTLRDNWTNPSVRCKLMISLLRQKFREEPLRELLLKTGEAELIEGNDWNDTFWGVCRGHGDNVLGRLLMHVRKELREMTPLDLEIEREG